MAIMLYTMASQGSPNLNLHGRCWPSRKYGHCSLLEVAGAIPMVCLVENINADDVGRAFSRSLGLLPSMTPQKYLVNTLLYCTSWLEGQM
ncbi:hypothetical protein Ae201684P_002642 [Aphanomyces euteiches]|nr:hypothetical protein Ae201684P_002642 [Aphanomyces euteiches]